MEWKEMAPWIAIAITLILSILVPLFTQIANNRHQRKLQREKIEYEEAQKKIVAFEEFLTDVGNAVVFGTKANMEKAGSSIYRMYMYSPTEWLAELDKLSDYLRHGESGEAAKLMQKLARLISYEINNKENAKE